MASNITLREAWPEKADCRHCSLRSFVLFAGLEERDSILNPAYTPKSGSGHRPLATEH